MQAAPNCVASRVPFHFFIGSGGFQRIVTGGRQRVRNPLEHVQLAFGGSLQFAGG